MRLLATALGRLVARGGIGMVAAGGAGLAAALGWHHPLSPVALCLVLWTAAVFSAWRPGAWLFWLPALLPLLNFSPWSGWWLVDESDGLVCAVLAGAYARWAFDLGACAAERRRSWTAALGSGGWGALCLLLAGSLVVGVWRGWADAGAPALGWPALRGALQEGLYAGYDSAWNTWRVAKSLVWALLLWPLMRRATAAHPEGAGNALARGMVVGLAAVCLVVLWERQVYTGLWDFSQPYRTSAWFWEMHVGGGALDAYLALAAPFALWAVWTAPTPMRWVAANALLWATVYAVLTTYSRGVYLALLLSAAFMLASAWRLTLQPACGAVWRRRAVADVLLALGLQSALVLGGGAFMGERLARADNDLLGRVAHWRAGVDLLQTPADWALGLGMGRLPAHYSRRAPGGEFPGQAPWRTDAHGVGHVALLGPPAGSAVAARHFSLTQRIGALAQGRYRVRVMVQAEPAGRLMLTLCERHALYSGACQWRPLAWRGALQEGKPGAEERGLVWLEGTLNGDAWPSAGRGWAQAGGVLAVSPTQAGQSVRLYAVELIDPSGRQVLRNSRFAQQLQHWLPAAQGHFLPWHLDNVYLEVLVERGGVGLLAWALLVAWALNNLWWGLKARDTLAWALAGSLLGMGALGCVISVMELPRVALILLLLVFKTQQYCGRIDKFVVRNAL